MSGKIYYGMHFYPGLAQYNEANGESYKILLTEETLRKMDRTFPGKPAFVEHVENVEKDRNKLRNEADAWVIESFYNEPDGKHWSKFITVTDEADEAIANGYRLSNAYNPQLNGRAGVWNGIPYDNEVVDGEYEHLAIVENPRYAESIIMTPEQFKSYNEKLKLELSKISNSKPQENKMSIKDLFFTRKAVDNSLDLEKTLVCLPKSKKEYSIIQIVNAMDEVEEKKKLNEASDDMKVKMHDGTICNVSELIEKYKVLGEKLENATKKDKDDDEDDDDEIKNEDDEDDDDEKKKKENEDDDEDDDEEKKKMKNKKMKNAIEKTQNFNSLKNAHLNNNFQEKENRLMTNNDKVLLGKSMFGS